jgi:hypothetical protein
MNMVRYWADDKGVPAFVRRQYPQHLNDPLVKMILMQFTMMEECLIQRIEALSPEDALNEND